MLNNPSTSSRQPTPRPNRGGAGGGAVSTIGFFDGVHRGHQCLIQQVKEEARRRGAQSLLITFDRHPRAVFAPGSVPPLLTTAEEKMALLRATGVDDIFVLPFDRSMAALTAREFMRQVLKEQLGVTALVMGYDHRFGKPEGLSTDFEHYQTWGREEGLDIVLAHELEGEHVSSSAIRQALETGNVTVAAHLLGRPYTWTGRVVHGHGIGRQLGFPTANLEASEPAKLLPACGAYAVVVNCSSPTGEEWERKAMLNIGRRPTLENGDDVSVEVNIFDFHADIYSECIRVSLVKYIREEQKFDSVETLKKQLQTDEAVCRSIFNF